MTPYSPETDRRGGIYISVADSNADPNRERRDYALDGESPLVGLIDDRWYPPYVADRSHYHNCLEIGCCVAGQGLVELGSRSWDYGPGAVVAAGQGLHHRQENMGWPATHWRYILVDEDVFLQEAPSRHREALRRLVDTARRKGLYFDAGQENSELRAVGQAIFGIAERRGEMARMELEAAVCLLLCTMARSLSSAMTGLAPDGAYRRPIEPALKYVSENYMRELRAEELAASCAMSASYFRKVFGHVMGMSPMEYVNRYRINRALNLLRYGNDTVLQIAVQTGFSSVATFNRNFRRYVGDSPANWRKNAHI